MFCPSTGSGHPERRRGMRRGEFSWGPQRGSRVGVAMDTRKHVSRKQNVAVARLIQTVTVRLEPMIGETTMLGFSIGHETRAIAIHLALVGQQRGMRANTQVFLEESRLP